MTYDKAASYCINMGMHAARKIAVFAEPTDILIQYGLKLFASKMNLGKWSQVSNKIHVLKLYIKHVITSNSNDVKLNKFCNVNANYEIIINTYISNSTKSVVCTIT